MSQLPEMPEHMKRHACNPGTLAGMMLSTSELVELGDKERDFGPWVFNAGNLTLSCDGYEVDLERCTTSAEVLDWIMQVNGKSWGPAAMAGLVDAIDTILHPQANLCSGGQSKTITRAELSKLARRRG